MEVALIEIPVHILEGLRRENLLSKESYTMKEVYTFGAKDRPEYVKKLAALKITESEIRKLYTIKNQQLKDLEL